MIIRSVFRGALTGAICCIMRLLFWGETDHAVTLLCIAKLRQRRHRTAHSSEAYRFPWE